MSTSPLRCLLLFSSSIMSDSLWPQQQRLDCSRPGFLIFHYLPEFPQTHLHWVDDAIQPSHPLLPLSPPALNPSLCVCVCVCVSCLVESDSLQPHRSQPIRPLCPWDSPGKNNGMGCHFLLQKELEKGRKWSCSVVSDSLQPLGL